MIKNKIAAVAFDDTLLLRAKKGSTIVKKRTDQLIRPGSVNIDD